MTLALLHHQPAPPTHAPPSAQDTDAPGRQGWKSVDLMRPRDSHWVEETTLSPEPTQEPLREGSTCCHPQGYQDPQTPKSPVGCLLGYTLPQSSQLQPEFSDGEMEAQRGENQSIHA